MTDPTDSPDWPQRYALRAGSLYGIPIGILRLDTREPLIPGDVGNASTFSCPVTYEIVPGCTIERLIYEGDPTLEEAMIAAAQRLVDRGVRFVTSNCGFMQRFQLPVANAIGVPTLLSSLSQLPLISGLLPLGRAIGIITASASSLTPELLGSTGVEPTRRLVCAGLEDAPEFRAALLDLCGSLDAFALEAEVVAATKRLTDGNPDIGAILLECADLPPYARAVARAVDLPVFDYVTMIETVQRALNPPRYEGWY
jgi:hypothetical protein